MLEETEIIYSPLQQPYVEDGKRVEIYIYRMAHTGWTLEVVDEFNGSTVWDGEFETDQEALELALSELAEDGIDAYIGPAPGQGSH